MKMHFTQLAVAALLVFGAAHPGHAEDAAKAPPAAAQTVAPPASVARPPLAAKTAVEPAPPQEAAGAGYGGRRHAGRHRHFGRFRIAHFRPFSFHLPRLHRHRIHWRRFS
jgi:hypothetical protein